MAFSENSKGSKTPIVFAITSSTNATPIVVTKTSHGLSNGDIVHIHDHEVNISGNGVWVVANQTANTFELTGSVGVGTGVATGYCGREETLTDITSPAGKTTQCRVNYSNLVDGEWAELLSYHKVHGTSGALELFDSQIMAHAPGDGPTSQTSLFLPGLNNVKYAVVQHEGTARAFLWDIIEQ